VGTTGVEVVEVEVEVMMVAVGGRKGS